MTNSTNEYNNTAKALHWLMAVLIFGEWLIGTTLDLTSWYSLHFQIGALLLVLIILRIVWKVVARHPAMDSSLTPMNQLAAKLGHSLLYLLMLTVPCLGLSLVFTNGNPITLLGIPFPAFVVKGWFPDTRHMIKDTV